MQIQSPLPLWGRDRGVRVWETHASKERHFAVNCPHPNPLPEGEGTNLQKFSYHNGHPDLIPKGKFEKDACQHGSEGIEIKASRHSSGWQGHNAEDIWLMVFVPHERIGNHAFTQGQRGVNDSAQEGLGFQAGVVCNRPLSSWRALTVDYILKRAVQVATKPARLILPKAIRDFQVSQLTEPGPLFSVQRCEAGEWGARVTIEGRRYPPDTALAVGPLFQLVRIVFLHPVGRVCDDGVERVFREVGEPLETIRMDDAGSANLITAVVESKHDPSLHNGRGLRNGHLPRCAKRSPNVSRRFSRGTRRVPGFGRAAGVCGRPWPRFGGCVLG